MTSRTLSSHPRDSFGMNPFGHDSFRGHALSFLVSSSVLLGSMLAAHSAIVELNAANIGIRLVSFIEETRAVVAYMPHKAYTASVGHLNLDTQSTLYTSANLPLSSGLEEIFSPYLSLVSGHIDVNTGSVNGYIQTGAFLQGYWEMPNTGVVTKSSQIGSSETLAVVWETVEPYAAFVDTIWTGVTQIEDQATQAYVGGIYAWIQITSEVPGIVVRTAYGVGDTIIRVAANEIPHLHLEEMPVLTLWIDTANELARMLVKPQLVVGESVVASVNEIRSLSTNTQMQLGDTLSNVAIEFSQVGWELAKIVPRTATAAVADFLTLEEK